MVGEHLRNRLHAEQDPAMIRDRRYHLRMYSCCFVGRDLVDWLIKNGDANSRGGAIQCMNIFLENSIIHHGKYKNDRDILLILYIVHVEMYVPVRVKLLILKAVLAYKTHSLIYPIDFFCHGSIS